MKCTKLLALLACGCLLASCGENGQKKETVIGISIPSADHGWTGGVVYWAEQAEKDIEQKHPEIDVVISTGKSSSEQVSGIENLLMKGITKLVVLPHEPGALTAVCKRAKQRNNVELIVVDRGLSEQVQDLEVVGDNRAFGKACAEGIAKELNGKGTVVTMEGVPCQVNTDRMEGFREVMKNYPGITILQSERADWSEEKGYKVMENMLAKFPAIDAVWTGDDDVLRGALNAYSKSSRSDVKIMVGGGGSKFVVKKVLDKDPLVRLTVSYPPKMIYVAAQEAVKRSSAEKRIVVPADTIRQENAGDFYYPDSKY